MRGSSLLFLQSIFDVLNTILQVQREVLGTIEMCKNDLRVVRLSLPNFFSLSRSHHPQHLGAQFDDYWRQLKDFFAFKCVALQIYFNLPLRFCVIF